MLAIRWNGYDGQNIGEIRVIVGLISRLSEMREGCLSMTVVGLTVNRSLVSVHPQL
jgi:hypothetical protein